MAVFHPEGIKMTKKLLGAINMFPKGATGKIFRRGLWEIIQTERGVIRAFTGA